MIDENDVEQFAGYVTSSITEPWPEWPGGYPGQIEAALLDAVLSVRARYGSPSTGVRACVKRWQARRDQPVDDLLQLASWAPDNLAELLDNRQRLGGRLKTTAIIEAAGRLSAADVRHAAQLDPKSRAHADAYIGVRGLGPVTWAYFAMLLGHPGVKADTWVLRFVRAALGRDVSAKDAELLVGAAADRLGRSRTELDHAIWTHIRRRRTP